MFESFPNAMDTSLKFQAHFKNFIDFVKHVNIGQESELYIL